MPAVLDRMVRLRPAQAWLLVLLATDLAALLDLFAGPDIWFGPVYLLAICLAAWSLGWKAGQLTGFGCMALTFALNGFELYPYQDTAEFTWNLAMRVVAISMIVVIVAGLRRAYLREWWLGRIDQLTGALNRQAFFELALTTIGTHGWRILVYADLDGLKEINDIEGHAAGDVCLRSYGDAVRKMIRSEDIFARVGGDEFLILMSVKDEASTRAVATRLHYGMNRISLKRGAVRCSVGALAIPPGQASIEDLVRSADELMYAAKLRGAGLELGVATYVRPLARPHDRRASFRLETDRSNDRRSAVDRRRHSRVAPLPQVAPR